MKVRISLDKRRVLRYTPASFLSIRSTLNMTDAELGRELSAPIAAINPHILGTVLWAGFTYEDPGLSLRYVKGLVGSAGIQQRKEICRAISRAIKAMGREVDAAKRKLDLIQQLISILNRRVDKIKASFPGLEK